MKQKEYDVGDERFIAFNKESLKCNSENNGDEGAQMG